MSYVYLVACLPATSAQTTESSALVAENPPWGKMDSGTEPPLRPSAVAHDPRLLADAGGGPG